jgi:hypothetical protein
MVGLGVITSGDFTSICGKSTSNFGTTSSTLGTVSVDLGTLFCDFTRLIFGILIFFFFTEDMGDFTRLGDLPSLLSFFLSFGVFPFGERGLPLDVLEPFGDLPPLGDFGITLPPYGERGEGTLSMLPTLKLLTSVTSTSPTLVRTSQVSLITVDLAETGTTGISDTSGGSSITGLGVCGVGGGGVRASGKVPEAPDRSPERDM